MSDVQDGVVAGGEELREVPPSGGTLVPEHLIPGLEAYLNEWKEGAEEEDKERDF